jgi:hypothetical protein
LLGEPRKLAALIVLDAELRCSFSLLELAQLGLALGLTDIGPLVCTLALVLAGLIGSIIGSILPS